MFTSELIQIWQNLNFTYKQVQDWTNAYGNSFNPQDYEFINWLVNVKGGDYANPEWVLNNADSQTLKQEFEQTQQQAQILQPTYGTPDSSK